MKLKTIEKTPAPKIKRKGHVTVIQKIDDITVLNCYSSGKLRFRHCARLSTGEHATWYEPGYNKNVTRPEGQGAWTTNNLLTAYGFKEWWERENYRGNWSGQKQKYSEQFTQKDKAAAKALEAEIRELNKGKYWLNYQNLDWIDILDRIEREYDADKRENAAERKRRRINDLMEMIDGTQPDEFMTWGAVMSVGGMGVAIHNPEKDMFCCSECGTLSPRDKYIPPEGSRLGSNKPAYCPSCGRPVKILSRRRTMSMIEYSVPVAIIQEIDDNMSVMRHFKFYTYAHPDRQKELDWHETVRLIMFKGELKKKKRFAIYYNVCRTNNSRYNSYYAMSRGCASWQDTNPAGQRMVGEYIYPDPVMITDALKGTDYEAWARAFCAMSDASLKANYNNLLAVAEGSFPGIAELLCKGRFYRILSQASESIWAYSGNYFGRGLNLRGKDLLSVLGLKNMQTVARLRNADGDRYMLTWLKWSDEKQRKLSQAALEWLAKEHVMPEAQSYYPTSGSSFCIFDYMTPEKVMHYVQRQQAGGYKGESAAQVIRQWEDYMDMAKKLSKKTGDELIYKPADLKLRHDEYVIECEKHAKAIEARQNKERAKKMAADMRKRFPKSEEILKEIKPLLEWENEGYKIIVPKNLTEIIFEGNALHHCAGATDRYFDRICQHETYICFLRKKDKPKEPYYTIEVEPGGVIRQHRGMYDEEPEIEKVKPALKEWQKAIRKRMKKNDKLRAKESERKRIENIAYLREHINEKNNRFVLKGLEEDLMAL